MVSEFVDYPGFYKIIKDIFVKAALDSVHYCKNISLVDTATIMAFAMHQAELNIQSIFRFQEILQQVP